MKKITIIVCLILVSKFAEAKLDSLVQPQVRFSPTMIANLLTEEKGYLKLTYGQPFKKGRKIFGNLVPYDQLWRLGANEATEITISKDFEIDSRKVKAGTFTLFAKPTKDTWTIYFNKKLGQWGAFEYKESDNLFSTEIPATANSDIYEGFTIEIRERNSNAVEVIFLWDDVKAIMPVKLIEIIETAPVQETPRQKRKRLRKERRGK